MASITWGFAGSQREMRIVLGSSVGLFSWSLPAAILLLWTCVTAIPAEDDESIRSALRKLEEARHEEEDPRYSDPNDSSARSKRAQKKEPTNEASEQKLVDTLRQLLPDEIKRLARDILEDQDEEKASSKSEYLSRRNTQRPRDMPEEDDTQTEHKDPKDLPLENIILKRLLERLLERRVEQEFLRHRPRKDPASKRMDGLGKILQRFALRLEPRSHVGRNSQREEGDRLQEPEDEPDDRRSLFDLIRKRLLDSRRI
ncbi:unnamed protein product [Cyprideis torosa]|uniref:Uncharacterized protein n=1 Tax=Cyprideis torosa TaxID=163714 RepID=A0A7R8ZMU3_9CRUS|nr:unnamed protein product [Cyprideis torosa]CAG0886364.1 unnamed protein product [Cyprideis torosa]